MNTDEEETELLSAAGNDDALSTIGGRIKAIRKARGLRSGVVAKEIGLSRTSFNQWEAGLVKNPDTHKLGLFAEMADCSLEWLTKRKGADPDLTPPQQRRRRSAAPAIDRPRLDGAAPVAGTLPIPELTAAMSAHANALDLTARTFWQIPPQILELSFNCHPETTVIVRITSRADFNLSKGDYALIDTSRNRIDEGGTYIVADPDGLSAWWVTVTSKGAGFEVSMIIDDLQRAPKPTVDSLQPMGRVMGALKAT